MHSDLAPGESLFPACHSDLTQQKKEELWPLPLLIGTLMPSWGGPTFLTPSNPNYIPKPSPPNTITLKGGEDFNIRILGRHQHTTHNRLSQHEVGSLPMWAVGLPPGQGGSGGGEGMGKEAATSATWSACTSCRYSFIHSFNKHLPRTTEYQALCWALTLPSGAQIYAPPLQSCQGQVLSFFLDTLLR